jgi:hypothetical protein
LHRPFPQAGLPSRRSSLLLTPIMPAPGGLAYAAPITTVECLPWTATS